MRLLLPAALVLTALSCAPRPTAQPATAAAPPVPAAPAPAAPATPRPPDPIWMLGTAVATTADLAVVLKHLPPGAGTQPATAIMKDIQLFHGTDAQTVVLAMHGFQRSLGQKCSFCHEEKKFEADTDHKKIARQMILMADDLNRTTFGGKAEITCWTCHQGKKEPANDPKDMEARATKAIPPAFQVAPADASKPAKEVFKNLQLLGNVPAGEIPHLMGYFSAALGEDCAFCHVKDAPESDDNKHKRITRDMMRMSSRASASIEGTRGALTCWTCHRGEEHPPRPTAAKTRE